MKLDFYLIVNSVGGVRTVKNRPSLDWNEISIGINLKLPDSLFKKPQLSAQITVPDEAGLPQEIAADVQENVRLAIEEATGLNVQISFITPAPAPENSSQP